MMPEGAPLAAMVDEAPPDSCLLLPRAVVGGAGARFTTSPLGVRRALVYAIGTLKDQGVAGADLQTLELVLAEAMNNVVEHAYASVTDGEIDLEITRTGQELRCVICDHGRPMPDSRRLRADVVLPGRTASRQREGGFGWYLIHELSTDLVYVRSGGSNRLTFYIPLAAQPAV